MLLARTAVRPETLVLGVPFRRCAGAVFAVFALFALTSCSREFRNTIDTLSTLRSAIAAQFNQPAPTVALMNGRGLVITFENAFPDLSASDQQAKAHEVALYAAQHYNAVPLEGVTVVLVRRYGPRLFPLPVFTQSQGYSFSISELLGSTSPTPTVAAP